MGNPIDDYMASDETESKRRRPARVRSSGNPIDDYMADDEVASDDGEPQPAPEGEKGYFEGLGDAGMGFIRSIPFLGQGLADSSQREVAELKRRGPVGGAADRAAGLAVAPLKLAEDIQNTVTSNPWTALSLGAAGIPMAISALINPKPQTTTRKLQQILAPQGPEGFRTGTENFINALPIQPGGKTLPGIIGRNAGYGAGLSAVTAPGAAFGEGHNMSFPEYLTSILGGAATAGVMSGALHGLGLAKNRIAPKSEMKQFSEDLLNYQAQVDAQRAASKKPANQAPVAGNNTPAATAANLEWLDKFAAKQSAPPIGSLDDLWAELGVMPKFPEKAPPIQTGSPEVTAMLLDLQAQAEGRAPAKPQSEFRDLWEMAQGKPPIPMGNGIPDIITLDKMPYNELEALAERVSGYGPDEPGMDNLMNELAIRSTRMGYAQALGPGEGTKGAEIFAKEEVPGSQTMKPAQAPISNIADGVAPVASDLINSRSQAPQMDTSTEGGAMEALVNSGMVRKVSRHGSNKWEVVAPDGSVIDTFSTRGIKNAPASRKMLSLLEEMQKSPEQRHQEFRDARIKEGKDRGIPEFPADDAAYKADLQPILNDDKEIVKVVHAARIDKSNTPDWHPADPNLTIEDLKNMREYYLGNTHGLSLDRANDRRVAIDKEIRHREGLAAEKAKADKRETREIRKSLKAAEAAEKPAADLELKKPVVEPEKPAADLELKKTARQAQNEALGVKKDAPAEKPVADLELKKPSLSEVSQAANEVYKTGNKELFEKYKESAKELGVVMEIPAWAKDRSELKAPRYKGELDKMMSQLGLKPAEREEIFSRHAADQESIPRGDARIYKPAESYDRATSEAIIDEAYALRKGALKPKRGEEGKKLTPEERKQVLSKVKDAYPELGAAKEEWQDAGGEVRTKWAANQTDFMHTSDITGKKIRYYIELPDGRKAHPSELYPEIKQSDIDKAIAEEKARAKEDDFYREQIGRGIREDGVEAAQAFRKRNPNFSGEHQNWVREREGKREFYTTSKDPGEKALKALEAEGFEKVGVKPAEEAPQKTKGHIGFKDGYEYVRTPDGGVGRAPVHTAVGPDGYRMGLRFEGTKGWYEGGGWKHLGLEDLSPQTPFHKKLESVWEKISHKGDPESRGAFMSVVDAAVEAAAEAQGLSKEKLFEKLDIKSDSATGYKGRTDFQLGKAIISLTEGADISTALHEFAHAARRVLFNERQQKELADIMGVKGEWSKDHEEVYARSFEQYMLEGNTPLAKLKKVFGKIKSWMENIYAKVVKADRPLEIDESMRRHFDEMFGAKGETRGEQQGVQRFREARDIQSAAIQEKARKLVNLRKELMRTEPIKKEKPRPDMKQEEAARKKAGLKLEPTGESWRYESRLVDEKGKIIRQERDPSTNEERLDEVRKEISRLNREIGAVLQPGERGYIDMGDGEYLLVSHDQSFVEVGDKKAYEAALKDLKAADVSKVDKAAETLFQLYPRMMQNQALQNAVSMVRKGMKKVAEFSGLATDVDIVRQHDPTLHAFTQEHLGNLMKIGKGIGAENDIALAVAAKQARGMDAADVANATFPGITKKQHQYLTDLAFELEHYGELLKDYYHQYKAGMPAALQNSIEHQYSYATGKDIHTGTRHIVESGLVGKVANHMLGGLYDAVVTGNWHIHGLHAVDALIGAPATVGARNSAKAVISLLNNAEVRKFNAQFRHESGMYKRMRSDNPTWWDKHINRRLEGALNKTPLAAGLLKGARLTEGSWLEGAKLAYLRTAALHDVYSQMTKNSAGAMTFNDFMQRLNNDQLTATQSQAVYTHMLHTLNEAVGYVPYGFHNRFGLERAAGAGAPIVKLLQPFLGMRQVQSRLFMRHLEEATPQSLGRAGVMLGTIFALGGAAALPKPMAALLMATAGPGKLNEVEEGLNEAAPVPHITKRTVEHIKLDIAPWVFGSFDLMGRIMGEGADAAGGLKKVASGKGMSNHELKAAAKVLSYIAGSSNILGVTSLYQLAQAKDTLDKVKAAEREDKTAFQESRPAEPTKKVYAFRHDMPGPEVAANDWKEWDRNKPHYKQGSQKIHTSMVRELMDHYLGAGVSEEQHKAAQTMIEWNRVEDDLASMYGRKIARAALNDAWDILIEKKIAPSKVKWDNVYYNARLMSEENSNE